MKLKFILLFISMNVFGQSILPTPKSITYNNQVFSFRKEVTIAYNSKTIESALYLKKRLKEHAKITLSESKKGDIVIGIDKELKPLGEEGYKLKVVQGEINIQAFSNKGVFYGIQSLLQLLPDKVQAGKCFKLKGTLVNGIEIEDQPKYSWRSFMLDSGRQYQTPEFIKRYLDYMAMLKMNVFHWHLTEGQGWRIEIKKYPKLTEIGSNVASGKEQQGYYSQAEIQDIVSYASKLHIKVVPEIDVPGHSEAALIAYPEMTCFNKVPESIMSFSSNIFCGGKEDTYQFLQDILDEVCELFPSDYIHLGGDEAPKDNWDKCSHCLGKIKDFGLANSHDLQLYFSARLANYLKVKNKKAIFWGDVVVHDGMSLPDNVVIQWWNWRKHKDMALKNAIKRGHQVICNTNYYTYLNFPITPWSDFYKTARTFDLKMAYQQNPSDLNNPNPLVLGMGTSLWTDNNVQEHMIDKRVFPRVFVMAEQMWGSGIKLDFENFYGKVQSKYDLLEKMNIDYGPALNENTPLNYKWD